MKQHLKLGTIRGIPVGLNYGLLLIAGFYTVLLATEMLPASMPGGETGYYWLAAVAGVIMFFASILLHELAHSVVAQRNGIGVDSVTLWILGGVAKLKGEATTPGAEFRIAAAGPATNVVLGGIFFGASVGLDAITGPTIAGATLFWLAIINLALAAFNLIPASPLDGGRILAAIVWKIRDNKQDGRRIAAMSGALFGSFLMAFGLVGMLSGTGGIWFLAIGWFLRAASRQELRRGEIYTAAEGLTASDAMATMERSVNGEVTLAGLAVMVGEFDGTTPQAFPVTGMHGRPVGVIMSTQLVAINPKLADDPAEQHAIGWEKFVTAWEHESLTDVLNRMTEAACNHALVYDAESNQTGVITPDTVMAAKRETETPELPEPVAS